MPIKPSQVGEAKAKSIPKEVFEAFDKLIAEKWDGHASVITQAEAIAEVLHRLPGLSRSEVFKRHLLDVEDAYRKVGWSVEYDKPGYNETYEANFTFKKR